MWIPSPSCGSNDSCGLRPAAVAIGAIGLVPPAPSVPQGIQTSRDAIKCLIHSNTDVGVPLFLETTIQVRVRVMPKSCLACFSPRPNAGPWKVIPFGFPQCLRSPNVDPSKGKTHQFSYRSARQGIFQELKFSIRTCVP